MLQHPAPLVSRFRTRLRCIRQVWWNHLATPASLVSSARSSRGRTYRANSTSPAFV